MSSYHKLNPKIQKKVQITLELFRLNHLHSALRNHALKGELLGYRSINVTGDYRIIFRELSDGRYELIELINIGTHSQLY